MKKNIDSYLKMIYESVENPQNKITKEQTKMNFFKKFFKGLYNVLTYEFPMSYRSFEVRWHMFTNTIGWCKKIRKCVYEEIIDEYSQREDYNIKENILKDLIKIECTDEKIIRELILDPNYNPHVHDIGYFKRMYPTRGVFIIHYLFTKQAHLKELIKNDPYLEAIDLRRGLNRLDKSVIERLKNILKWSIDMNFHFSEKDQIPDYEDDCDKI